MDLYTNLDPLSWVLVSGWFPLTLIGINLSSNWCCSYISFDTSEYVFSTPYLSLGRCRFFLHLASYWEPEFFFIGYPNDMLILMPNGLVSPHTSKVLTTLPLALMGHSIISSNHLILIESITFTPTVCLMMSSLYMPFVVPYNGKILL